MSPNRQKMVARVARAGVASAALCAAVAAQAQSFEPARIVAPVSIFSVAAPAAMPAVTPAIVTPQARPVATQAAPAPSAAQPISCNASTGLAHFDRPLVRTARRLASGEPLTIVAVGSSSTAGAGASSPDASYPSRLAVELKQYFPAADITVINRGVNGEETEDMMARFESQVFPANPQLVLWQVGTNSVLRDRPLSKHAEQLEGGIDELKANTRADIVLIDPQYSPKVIEKSETVEMVDQVAMIAKEKNVDLFRRFAAMRDWHDAQHLSFDAFVSPDGLHMNDWGYACWAKTMAKAIAEAATRPVASAAAHVHSAR
jgi:acyl-CoA thioesterase I